jgi:CheY-like chemotaxis protein
MEKKLCQFLAIENDPDEAYLLARAFDKLHDVARVYICRNAGEARAYLTGAGMYADRDKYALPEILLSDLDVPMENGLDVLKWIREEPSFKNLPIVVLAGELKSETPIHELKVNGLIRKPLTPAGLLQAIESLIPESSGEKKGKAVGRKSMAEAEEVQ